MWDAATSDIPNGRKYRLLADGSFLTFRHVFELLRTSDDFCEWYSAMLAAFAAEAYYWELPPLTESSIDDASEFVLIEAPLLARLPPEPEPFSSWFEKHPGEDVVAFPNLGGDAILIAPCPRGPIESYPHLAAFLRRGEADQARSLWRVVAELLSERLGDVPVWLSTAGGGVSWLHLRLDSRPKYYSYRPYAE